MPEVAADPVGAILAFLLADSDIAAEVTARGFGGELPPAETAQMPRKCFVVRGSGGVSIMAGSFNETDVQRIDVTAYGRTPSEAGKLSSLIALKLLRLRRQVAGGVLIYSVNSAGGFTSGREPETEWPRAWRSFQVFFALVAQS